MAGARDHEGNRMGLCTAPLPDWVLPVLKMIQQWGERDYENRKPIDGSNCATWKPPPV